MYVYFVSYHIIFMILSHHTHSERKKREKVRERFGFNILMSVTMHDTCI